MTRLIGNRVEQCLNIADLRRAAARRAHRMVFDYIDGVRTMSGHWTIMFVPSTGTSCYTVYSPALTKSI